MTDLSPAGGDTAADASTSAADAAAPDATSGWVQGLEPELGALVAAKGWASPAEAVRSYQALERMLGADKIALPGAAAAPEAWDAVWQKLGRPAQLEGYGLARGRPRRGDRAMGAHGLPQGRAAAAHGGRAA